MQRSGIPTKTHQKGYAARHAETAVRRTFQIKTFSTELKNHVMVMDFVKSNWFPSQRKAKVCIIHMYQGLKTAEQTAGRYEVWLNLGRERWAHTPSREMELCSSGRQFRCSSWSNRLIICLQFFPRNLEKTFSSLNLFQLLKCEEGSIELM